jgi:hypothetical protein
VSQQKQPSVPQRPSSLLHLGLERRAIVAKSCSNFHSPPLSTTLIFAAWTCIHIKPNNNQLTTTEKRKNDSQVRHDDALCKGWYMPGLHVLHKSKNAMVPFFVFKVKVKKMRFNKQN